MPKQQVKKTRAKSNTKKSLYIFSIASGILIAFLMFNDVIMAILFGIPIGIVFGLALQDNQRSRASKR